MLLIESGKGHLAQNKSENFVGSFAAGSLYFLGRVTLDLFLAAAENND